MDSATKRYHEQFQIARTDAERQRLATDYKVYYAQLSDAEKARANKIKDIYFARAKQEIEAMEPILQRAKDKLSRTSVAGRVSKKLFNS